MISGFTLTGVLIDRILKATPEMNRLTIFIKRSLSLSLSLLALFAEEMKGLLLGKGKCLTFRLLVGHDSENLDCELESYETPNFPRREFEEGAARVRRVRSGFTGSLD